MNARRHQVDSAACWCGPTFYIPCPGCEPEEYAGASRAYLPTMPLRASCHRCTNGLIRISRAKMLETDGCVVVVHT